MPSLTDRTIFHIDFDSFFASCEQHFNPNLRGVPIGVTAANGRTCIIAASREAKKFGVKTGTRSWEAERLCPQIQLVKADFDRYLEVTKKFIQIASLYSPLVEVFSLDEVFIDITPVLHLHKSVDDIVAAFKKQIAEEISPTITVSVGVSYNKLLAKLASGMNKPDGFAAITKENLDTVYKQTELTDICGIGERFKQRLNFLGITNLIALRRYPLSALKQEFGSIASQNLMSFAWGYDNSPVISYLEETDAKSVGRNYCLPENEYDREKILQILFELSEEIAIKLRRLKKSGRTVGLYLSGEGNYNQRKTAKSYTNSGQDIFGVCKALYDSWKDLLMVRQVGIYVSNLIDENYVNMSLFDNPKKEVVVKTMDRINEHFGHHTIRKGYVLSAPQLDTKPNGFLADRYQRESLRKIA